MNMLTKQKIEFILQLMQDNDPNGDWVGAPIDYDTLTAMYWSLDNWSRDGNDFDHKMFGRYAEDMEDAWDAVYTKIWDGKVITDLEWEIFKHQAGDYDLTHTDGRVWIILGNRECRLMISQD